MRGRERERERETVRDPDKTALYASHPLIEGLSQHELYTMSTNMDKLLHAIQGSRGRPRNALQFLSHVSSTLEKQNKTRFYIDYTHRATMSPAGEGFNAHHWA